MPTRGSLLGVTTFQSAEKRAKLLAEGLQWIGWGEEWPWNVLGDGVTVNRPALEAKFDLVLDAGLSLVAGFMGIPAACNANAGPADPASPDGHWHWYPNNGTTGELLTYAAAYEYAAALPPAGQIAGEQRAILSLGNEIQIHDFDHGDQSPYEKGRYFLAAIQGAHAGNPGLPIGAWATAAWGDLNNAADLNSPPAGRGLPHDYVRRMLIAVPELLEPANLPDFVTFHPYAFSAGANANVGWNGLHQLDALAETLSMEFGLSIPIMPTEFGHPGGPTAQNPLWTEENQATEAHLLLQHLLWRETVTGTVGGPWLFLGLVDGDVGTGTSWDVHMGIFRADFSDKPVSPVFREWAAMEIGDPAPDPGAGWQSTGIGWESTTEGWDSVLVPPAPPPYVAIPDAAGTRRAQRWKGAAPTYTARAYPGDTVGPRRAISTTDLLEMRGVNTRASTFRFDVLDKAFTLIGTLDVDGLRPPKITNDSTRTIKRSLDGLNVDPATALELDTLGARIRPTVILEDGTEYPLGVFLFVDASRNRLEAGLELGGSLHDLLFTLDQPTEKTTAYPRGTRLTDIITEQAHLAGIPFHDNTPSPHTATAPLAWPAGTKRLAIMDEVALMNHCMSPYVDNAGVLRCIPPPAPIARYDYLLGGRIVSGTPPVESDDILKAPNVYIVLDDASTDSPIVGRYELPASSPLSITNRGFAIADVRTLQGLADQAAADEAAYTAAYRDGAGYQAVTFSAIPDWRHDTYDVLRYLDGNDWRETSWDVELSPTALMTHQARRLYA